MLTSLITGAIHVYIVMSVAVVSIQGATDYFTDYGSYEVDGHVVEMTESQYSDAVVDGTIRPKLRPSDL